MNVSAPIFALCMVADAAQALSMIGALWGQDHINQVAEIDDSMPNPDGYYLRSMKTHLSHGDTRIVEAVTARSELGSIYYVCMD